MSIKYIFTAEYMAKNAMVSLDKTTEVPEKSCNFFSVFITYIIDNAKSADKQHNLRIEITSI